MAVPAHLPRCQGARLKWQSHTEPPMSLLQVLHVLLLAISLFKFYLFLVLAALGLRCCVNFL